MYINPYEGCDFAVDMQQRSNLHTHCGTGPNTCGEYEIQDVVSTYSKVKYGVLGITNHNIVSDLSGIDPCGMQLVGGYEYTTLALHMLCLWTKRVCMDSHQAAIDTAREDGGFVVINHPHAYGYLQVPLSLLDQLQGYGGIEIYNGEGGLICPEGYAGPCVALDVYDYVLSSGRLCWAFGSDDFHRWWHTAGTYNMLLCPRDAESVRNAIENGKFYVSTGLTLRYFRFENGVITLSAMSSVGWVYDCRYRFYGRDGKLLSETEGKEASYALRGDELYVRVEVLSPSGKLLYTQPVYDSEGLHRGF